MGMYNNNNNNNNNNICSRFSTRKNPGRPLKRLVDWYSPDGEAGRYVGSVSWFGKSWYDDIRTVEQRVLIRDVSQSTGRYESRYTYPKTYSIRFKKYYRIQN